MPHEVIDRVHTLACHSKASRTLQFTWCDGTPIEGVTYGESYDTNDDGYEYTASDDDESDNEHTDDDNELKTSHMAKVMTPMMTATNTPHPMMTRATTKILMMTTMSMITTMMTMTMLNMKTKTMIIMKMKTPMQVTTLLALQE